MTANDIKNLALMELNHETISDWTSTTNTDIPIINTQYALALPIALSRYQWSFADKYAKLTTSAVPSTDGYQKYTKQATLPTDCLGNISCWTDKYLHSHPDYDIVGTTIYTNLSEIYIKYTASVSETALTNEFIDWFKTFLACRLNSYLNADLQRQQVLDNNEMYLFKAAKNMDSKKNLHESVDGTPLLWVRGAMR